MRRSLPHPSVRTEHTPIDLTHTPLDFPLSGARLHPSTGPHLPTPHAATAHGRTPNQHRSCDCSSCPSTHRECGDRVSHFDHSSCRAVSPLGPVPTHNHFVIRTGCSCQSANEAKPAPQQIDMSQRTLLTRLGIALTLVSRSLGHSFAFSSASCPGDILSGGSWTRECKLSATAIATPASFLLSCTIAAFCVNDSSVLRAPRSFSLVLLVHLASLLILSIVSGTFFNSLDRLLSHIFGTSLGIRATPPNLIPAMIQRLPAV